MKNIRTYIGYRIDCLTTHTCKTLGKYRLKWSCNVLISDTSSIQAMLTSASYFTGVKKWRVAGRYIAHPGHSSGLVDTAIFIPVSKIERDIIESALLAASDATNLRPY